MPFKRDGYWMGYVRKLQPQNLEYNWLGPWLEDGPPFAVLDQVASLSAAKQCFLFI